MGLLRECANVAIISVFCLFWIGIQVDYNIIFLSLSSILSFDQPIYWLSILVLVTGPLIGFVAPPLIGILSDPSNENTIIWKSRRYWMAVIGGFISLLGNVAFALLIYFSASIPEWVTICTVFAAFIAVLIGLNMVSFALLTLQIETTEPAKYLMGQTVRSVMITLGNILGGGLIVAVLQSDNYELPLIFICGMVLFGVCLFTSLLALAISPLKFYSVNRQVSD